MPFTTSKIGDYAFSSCGALEYISIGDETTSIGSNAFSSCTKLKSIKIGANITSIGSNAFSSCTNLKIIYLHSPNIAVALTSSTAAGNLIKNAEVVLAEKSVENLATFVTLVYSYVEELNYEGVDYISYSLHEHKWVNCSVENIMCNLFFRFVSDYDLHRIIF